MFLVLYAPYATGLTYALHIQGDDSEEDEEQSDEDDEDEDEQSQSGVLPPPVAPPRPPSRTVAPVPPPLTVSHDTTDTAGTARREYSHPPSSIHRTSLPMYSQRPRPRLANARRRPPACAD